LTVSQSLELAEQDILLIRKPDGAEFVLSAIDDFAAEVEALSQNIADLLLAIVVIAFGIALWVILTSALRILTEFCQPSRANR